jgi:hypothetical protein
MHLRKYALFVVAFVIFLVPVTGRAQDLKSVLARLDAAATNFHAATADFEYDISITDPVPDTDVQ